MNAALEVASRYAKAYRIERLARDQVVAEAVATKTPPPNGYWQGEREAALKLQIAAVLTDELTE